MEHNKHSLQSNSNSQKGFVEMVLVLVGFFVLAGAGIYWYISQSNLAKQLSTPNFAQQLDTELAEPSPTPDTSTASLTTDLESIYVEDPFVDFADIDTDLSNL